MASWWEPAWRHAPAVWVGKNNGIIGLVGVQTLSISQLLRLKWSSEKPTAIDTHNSACGRQHENPAQGVLDFSSVSPRCTLARLQEFVRRCTERFVKSDPERCSRSPPHPTSPRTRSAGVYS